MLSVLYLVSLGERMGAVGAPHQLKRLHASVPFPGETSTRNRSGCEGKRNVDSRLRPRIQESSGTLPSAPSPCLAVTQIMLAQLQRAVTLEPRTPSTHAQCLTHQGRLPRGTVVPTQDSIIHLTQSTWSTPGHT